MARRGRMSFRDAMDLVPDDMPDGAYWAMAHEMAGLDYGDGFDELIEEEDRKSLRDKPCKQCGKRFGSDCALQQHVKAKHNAKKGTAP